MTHLDDVELGRRLKALRVEPPQAAEFEARLAQRLLAPEREAPAAGARVLVGPWRRRGPVRLVGAVALLLAGAAAAMEGGVVDWVQARVFRHVDDHAPLAAPPAEVAAHGARRARPQLERTPLPEVAPEPPQDIVAEPAPVPAVPVGAGPVPGLEHPERRIAPARQASEHAQLQPGREALVREHGSADGPLRSGRPGDEPLRVPRVAIERRWGERPGAGERRLDRRLPQLDTRDTQRPLEHLREVARQRRERGAGEHGTGQRAPSLERLRERRERMIERRDVGGERERRDGDRRERGGR